MPIYPPEEYSIERAAGTSGPKPKPLAVRIKEFYSHIKVHSPDDPDGCDLWQLSLTKSGTKNGGYPQFNINGTIWRGNRLMWVLNRGPIPDGLDVLHHCDHPPCLRLEHLHVDTAKRNMEEMEERGRAVHPSGIEKGDAKLTEEQVGIILALLKTGVVNKNQVSKHFKMDRGTIGKIEKGLAYKGCASKTVDEAIVALANEIGSRYRHGPNSGSFKSGHLPYTNKME